MATARNVQRKLKETSKLNKIAGKSIPFIGKGQRKVQIERKNKRKKKEATQTNLCLFSAITASH